MVINIYQISSILGLIFIIIGTFMISLSGRTRKRIIYPVLLLGGIFLLIYSLHIKDTIFIILQFAYIAIVIFDIIKLFYLNRKTKQKKEIK